MFCTKCGASISTHDRFCAKYGATGNATLSATATLPIFGPFVDRRWGPFRAKNSYPLGYEWISQRNTLLICKDHLVLINGDEKRSRAMDITSAMGGLIGVMVGGLIRVTKNTTVNKRFDLTPALADALFDKR